MNQAPYQCNNHTHTTVRANVMALHILRSHPTFVLYCESVRKTVAVMQYVHTVNAEKYGLLTTVKK